MAEEEQPAGLPARGKVSAPTLPAWTPAGFVLYLPRLLAPSVAGRALLAGASRAATDARTTRGALQHAFGTSQGRVISPRAGPRLV
jgi:hypothetical protein